MTPQIDFKQALADSGIPTTEEAVTSALEHTVKEAGSQIANDRTMSPFWRLIKAVVVTPTLWLINTLVAGHVLPAMFVSTAKGFYLELKGRDVDVSRLPATTLKGYLTFVKSAPEQAVTIAAGTIVETLPIDGKILAVKTSQTATLAAGVASGLIECEATEPGQGHNLPSGYFNRLITPIEGIAQVSNAPDWIVRPGQAEETDEALALRIRNRYGAAGHYHIDAVYRDVVAQAAGIRVDYMVFEHDAPRGPGTANCYIFMPVGEVPSAVLDKVNQHIAAGFHGHGDDLQVFAMPTVPHTLSGHFWPSPHAAEQDKARLGQELAQRIQAAFRQHDGFGSITRVWPMSTFSMSQLITEMHQSLPALGGIHFDQGDITSARTLPILDSLTLEKRDSGTR